MINRLIIQLIKKHGILFLVELLKDFLLEYRQQSVMSEIEKSNNINNNHTDINNDKENILNQFFKK